MKFLSVNIRGFKKNGKVNWYRGMITSNNPVVAAIQDTKRRYVKDKWVENLWGSHNVEYVVKYAVGRSGGLLLICYSNIFKVNQVAEGDHLFVIKGTLSNYDTEIVVVNVYGPHCDEKKKKLWTELNRLLQFDNVAWVLCGDFNEVRSSAERENTNFIARRANLFNEFIHNNSLIEVPLMGKKYTRISDDGTQFSKLDHFLVSENFATLWDDLYVAALDRNLSDHTPLLLKNPFVYLTHG
ncbi:uncharacterized protein [Rutidosis leptorrhynchoides]|uniref:uncharacterized protein n=1 Tax=Rutidosis leptorrhynchoides TaxID=125765 RepID=UPI003A995B5D